MVATPVKCPGREAPSNRSPTSDTVTVVTEPFGYISAASGANKTSTLSASSDLQSASNVRGYFAKSSPGANCSGFTKMEATTVSHSDRARRTKDRCPSCRAPIVGTKPSTKRLVRKSRQTPCISATVLTIRTAVPSLLFAIHKLLFLELQSSNTTSLRLYRFRQSKQVAVCSTPPLQFGHPLAP